MRLSVQDQPFDFGQESDAFAKQSADLGAGAVVTFCGIVRDTAGALSAMQIEHYPGMTEKAIAAMMDQAATRWDLSGALVIHRHGHLTKGELIMMVATASRHRAASFAAADFLMDYLKSRAPFWKKEMTLQGGHWVQANAHDETALTRW